MPKLLQTTYAPLFLLLLFTYACSKKTTEIKPKSAYFGGEVVNPKSNYLIMYKNDQVIDTLFINQKNQFGKKFDSLEPGMYLIKHGTNTKYVYFDQNDSLRLFMNTRDFENTSSFYGQGKDKNNFLLELFSQSKANRDLVWSFYNKPYAEFRKNIDSLKDNRTAFYLRRKTEIGWNNDFDVYAKAVIDYDYFTQLEAYPYAHAKDSYQNTLDSLPEDYYKFRNKVNLNNEALSEFQPFTRYLAARINGIIAHRKLETIYDESMLKLAIVDSLISDKKVKNSILNNVAYQYFVEDQNEIRNAHFMKSYKKLVTDARYQKEIFDVKKSIHFLSPQQELPYVSLLDRNLQPLVLQDTISEPTIVFFWSKNAMHLYNASLLRAQKLLKTHKNLTFIAVNIDGNQPLWQQALSKRTSYPKIIDAFANDFDQLCDQWFITKLNRCLLLHKDGSIKNAFLDFSDKNFEKNL